MISSLTKACKLRNDKVKLRLPIQKGMLGILLRETKHYFENVLNQPFLSILYQAILSTAYFGLFRIGEVTAGDHPILARDVHIGANKKKILFLLRSSKTHNQGLKPQSVKKSSQPTKVKADQENRENSYHLCPYELLRNYAKIRGPYNKNENQQFFIFADGSRVTAQHTRKYLDLMLKRSRFDTKLYCFHGLCMGRTHDLLRYGLMVETIKKLGRWKSNAVFRYLH